MDNRPTPPQPISYNASLTPTARAAAIASVIAETIFTIYYLVSAYPAPLVAIQVAASLLGAFGLVLLRRSSATRIAAQVLTGALYISVIGLALFTGGLLSSASPWLVFVPIMATVILGAQGGLFWGGVSLLSAVGLYLFRGLLLAWALHPTQDIDRLMDLSFAVLSGTAAVYVNELIKSRAMKELDEAKAQLTRLANLDPLTNIYNRRHFITRSETALQNRSANVPFSILLLDIDHFKEINDLHGHEIGDQALVGVVAVCSAILRKADIFARFGGEEFIALLPNTTQETAVAIAERLRVALEGAALPTAAGDLRLTVSVGISLCCGERAATVQELIRRADEALYQAKESGRNQVVCWRD